MSAAARLADLAGRWGLSEEQHAALARVLEVLEQDPLAPSPVSASSVAVDVHVADSLSALALDCVANAAAIADLGAGAGFPGVPLAIALPRARVALVESVRRKADFIDRLCATAGAANAAAVWARAEDWPAGRGAHDLVTARALAPLAVLCEYAAPLLVIDGSLVAWKGSIGPAEAAAAERAAPLLGLAFDRVVRSEPYPGSVAHHLHVFRKVAPTPAGFPRRPGVARKRPLGGAA